MKLNSKIQVKRTKKLFDNTYQYKAVVVCVFSSLFRGKNLQFAEKKLEEFKATGKFPVWGKKATVDDVNYAKQLCKFLSNITDYDVRVESPFISFYSNNFADIKAITDISVDAVKYVSKPETQEPLEKNTVYVKKLEYDYKVTLGKTNQNYTNFINWAKSNANKVRLPGRCIYDLSNDFSWGGSYFYVKDEKSLTMVKMFIGSNISRIDHVIKVP